MKHKEAYNEARNAFDGLKIEDQAIFLVESAISMLAQGIEQVGAMMARQFDDEACNPDEGTTGKADGTTDKANARKDAGAETKKEAAGKSTGKATTARKPRVSRPKTDPSA